MLNKASRQHIANKLIMACDEFGYRVSITELLDHNRRNCGLAVDVDTINGLSLQFNLYRQTVSVEAHWYGSDYLLYPDMLGVLTGTQRGYHRYVSLDNLIPYIVTAFTLIERGEVFTEKMFDDSVAL